MRHAGKHSWSGRRQRPERAAWPSRPERSCLWFCLFHTALLGLRCWIWGFPWKTGRVCLVCVGFVFSPPSLFWSWVNCHRCCESRWLLARSWPLWVNSKQRLTSISLEREPRAQKQRLLWRCLEVALGLMVRCHKGGDNARNIWKNSSARPASSPLGSRICPKSGWEVPGSSSCLQRMEQH